MAVNPKSLENLIPAVKGEVRNPTGLPKEAANVRVQTQRMWGLYYSDPAAYDVEAAKFPRIAEQIEARAKQSIEGNTAAITRVDSENLGPLVQKIDMESAVKAMSDDQLVALLAAIEAKQN